MDFIAQIAMVVIFAKIVDRKPQHSSFGIPIDVFNFFLEVVESVEVWPRIVGLRIYGA